MAAMPSSAPREYEPSAAKPHSMTEAAIARRSHLLVACM